MAEVSARSSVSSLQSSSVQLDPRSLLGLTTLELAFLNLTIVSVAPMYGTVAGLQGPRILTGTS